MAGNLDQDAVDPVILGLTLRAAGLELVDQREALGPPVGARMQNPVGQCVQGRIDFSVSEAVGVAVRTCQAQEVLRRALEVAQAIGDTPSRVAVYPCLYETRRGGQLAGATQGQGPPRRGHVGAVP